MPTDWIVVDIECRNCEGLVTNSPYCWRCEQEYIQALALATWKPSVIIVED